MNSFLQPNVRSPKRTQLAILMFLLIFISGANLELKGQVNPFYNKLLKSNNKSAFNRVGPTVLKDDLSIRSVGISYSYSVRLAADPSTSILYYATSDGRIIELSPETGTLTTRFTSNDHGMTDLFGFDISSNGNMYLVGNNRNGKLNQGIIRRGRIEGENRIWELVAETEPYPLSTTAFDHTFNGIAISPDDQFLYVNSGSRTDHGEEQNAGGEFPGVREVPITSAILKIPANATNLYLENDSTFLWSNGYIFADGTRNHFDLAFDNQGRLFGTENSGDRDDPEELNWLKEGAHYGFPWRMGSNETPMQFEGYNPLEDKLVNPSSLASRSGFFYNDPDYPAPPSSLQFESPIENVGPDADNYRDPSTGDILDASDRQESIYTFTSHRSPLGLTFDNDAKLGANYTMDGFVLGWTGSESSLLSAMNDAGEDVLHMEMEYLEAEDRMQVKTTKIASGFINPIDAELVGNTLYVLEFVFSGTGTIWAIDFPVAVSNEPESAHQVGRVSLSQNYPNPFNPTTSISYTIDQGTDVLLEVFDITGRRVSLLEDSYKAAGSYEVSFSGDNLSSGVYFYRLTSPLTQMTKQMLLLK